MYVYSTISCSLQRGFDGKTAISYYFYESKQIKWEQWEKS